MFDFVNRYAICWIPLCSRTEAINLMVNILFIVKDEIRCCLVRGKSYRCLEIHTRGNPVRAHPLHNHAPGSMETYHFTYADNKPLGWE